MKRSKTSGTVTGEPRIIGPGFRAKVYALAKQVPAGFVTTYGDVAGALGSRRIARQVGFAMAALDDDTVPWQRVINSAGRISFKGDLVRADRQRAMLEKEGIAFDVTGKVVDFEMHRHKFRAPRATRAKKSSTQPPSAKQSSAKKAKSRSRARAEAPE